MSARSPHRNHNGVRSNRSSSWSFSGASTRWNAAPEGRSGETRRVLAAHRAGGLGAATKSALHIAALTMAGSGARRQERLEEPPFGHFTVGHRLAASDSGSDRGETSAFPDPTPTTCRRGTSRERRKPRLRSSSASRSRAGACHRRSVRRDYRSSVSRTLRARPSGVNGLPRNASVLRVNVSESAAK
jgi:hypothetical protein